MVYICVLLLCTRATKDPYIRPRNRESRNHKLIKNFHCNHRRRIYTFIIQVLWTPNQNREYIIQPPRQKSKCSSFLFTSFTLPKGQEIFILQCEYPFYSKVGLHFAEISRLKAINTHKNLSALPFKIILLT